MELIHPYNLNVTIRFYSRNSRDPLRKISVANRPLNLLIYLCRQKPIGRYSNFSANSVSLYKIEYYTLPKSNAYHTENRLNGITFENEKLLKIIQSLDAKKSHGYDGISVRMLNLSSPSIITPLSIIFQNCLKCSIFPNDWKKRNTVHKKNS